jgi:hypothetical protein
VKRHATYGPRNTQGNADPPLPSCVFRGQNGGEHYTRLSDFDLPKPLGMEPDGPPAHRHGPYDPNLPARMLPAFPEPHEPWDGNPEWFELPRRQD